MRAEISLGNTHVALELSDEDILLVLQKPLHAMERIFKPAMLQLVAEERRDLLWQYYEQVESPTRMTTVRV